MSTNNNESVKTAVIYLRVSTEEQVDNFSLDTQEDICQKEAIKRGVEVIKVFREEGKSAKTITGRPVLIEMLEYCRKNKKKIDAVIAYRVDRISRQTQDYLAIRKRLTECGITLISATEPTGNSPTEKLVETILAGFAQLDNDVRSERTKNGMRARFLAGLPNGKVPLGYLNIDGCAVKDPEKWDLVKKSWDLMETGTKTLNEIAVLMNEWGLRNVIAGRECLFRAQTASRLFKNKFYAGVLASPRYPDEAKGQHIQMISEAQYYKVQAVIAGRNNSINIPVVRRNRNNSDFPLRRIVKCGGCGAPFTGAWSKGKRAKHAYYFCRSRCGKPSVRAYDVDFLVVELLRRVTPKKETLDAFIALLRANYYKRVAGLQKKKEHADVELKRLQGMRKGLVEKNLSGVYSDEIFKEQNKIIEEQIMTLEITKDDSLLSKYNLEAIIGFMKDKFADLGKTYQDSDIEQIKVLLCSIFDSELTWDYSGISNTKINAVYQYIYDFESVDIANGDPTGNRTPLYRMKTCCPNR
jgi:site-specific DNA recombinase